MHFFSPVRLYDSLTRSGFLLSPPQKFYWLFAPCHSALVAWFSTTEVCLIWHDSSKCVYFSLGWKDTDIQREEEIDIFHLLIHPQKPWFTLLLPATAGGWSSQSQQPRAPCMGVYLGARAQGLESFGLLPPRMCQLEQKRRSWDSKPATLCMECESTKCQPYWHWHLL